MKKKEHTKEIKSKKAGEKPDLIEKSPKKSLALPEGQRIQTAEGWKRNRKAS